MQFPLIVTQPFVQENSGRTNRFTKNENITQENIKKKISQKISGWRKNIIKIKVSTVEAA
jgi:hypothetical protein